MTLTSREVTPAATHTLTYETPDPEHVVLRGRVDGEDIVARLRRVDESKFLLLSRGFHWIQERPFNR